MLLYDLSYSSSGSAHPRNTEEEGVCGLYSPPMHTKMREGGGVSRNFAMKSRCRSEAFAGPKIGGRKARVAAGRAAAGRGGRGRRRVHPETRGRC